MIIEIVLVAVSGFNTWFITKNFIENRLKERVLEKNKVNPIVKEVCKSLEGDEGWEFFYPNFNEEQKTINVGHYNNDRAGIRFVLEPCLMINSLNGGIVKPIIYNFSFDDYQEIVKYVDLFKHRKLISARLNALDSRILELEENNPA